MAQAVSTSHRQHQNAALAHVQEIEGKSNSDLLIHRLIGNGIQKFNQSQMIQALRHAKAFMKKHEGDMKQSSQAKDILATYRTYIEKVSKSGGK